MSSQVKRILFSLVALAFCATAAKATDEFKEYIHSTHGNWTLVASYEDKPSSAWEFCAIRNEPKEGTFIQFRVLGKRSDVATTIADNVPGGMNAAKQYQEQFDNEEWAVYYVWIDGERHSIEPSTELVTATPITTASSSTGASLYMTTIFTRIEILNAFSDGAVAQLPFSKTEISLDGMKPAFRALMDCFEKAQKG